jgi:hypothetical protein
VEEAAQRGESFDVILIDSTDPVDAAVELFTDAFYARCGDLLGDARIERIEDTAVVVRQDGALRRLPLYGDVQRRPAPESAAPLALPAGANAIQRPIRPSDAGALSLARPESPSRPGARLDPSYRAGDPQ